MVIITWGITLGYVEMRSLGSDKVLSVIRHCTKHFFVITGAIALTVMAFCLYIYATRGIWPNLPGATYYASLFYFYGYFMLPMPGVHPWNIIVLVYIIGLFISISHLFDINGFADSSIQQGSKDDEAFYIVNSGSRAIQLLCGEKP